MTKWVFPIGQDVIKTLIPHRDPMLFVDRVMSLSDNKITIESDINPEAEFFRGHFPNQPIMPGVLIIETVAQAGALLISCLLYTSPSPRDATLSRMPSSA